jgi:hypothetical protein
MKKRCYLFLLSTLILLSCEPEFEQTRTFIIQEGQHYATPRLVETLQDSRLLFEARFDATAKYNLGDISMQSNKNKLLGFSDCNSLHHENSARFAWQWFNDRLEIFAYCYVNGERKEAYVGVVEVGTFSKYEIKITDDEYIFRLNDAEPVAINRGSVCKTGVYYKLWPYFGGSLPAPHTISIDVRPIH